MLQLWCVFSKELFFAAICRDVEETIISTLGFRGKKNKQIIVNQSKLREMLCRQSFFEGKYVVYF